MKIISGTKVDMDIWAGLTNCSNCKSIESFHLAKQKKFIKFCFFTILSLTTKKYLVCDNCSTCYEISNEEFKKIKKQQTQKLKNLEFPLEIVNNDYSHEKLKIKSQIVKLVFSFLLFVSMLFTSIVPNFSLELSNIVVELYLLFIFTTPFIISFKNLLKVCKLKSIKNSYNQNYIS